MTCGWTIAETTTSQVKLRCPSWPIGDTPPGLWNTDISTVDARVFVKKIFLMSVVIKDMFAKGVLPSNNSWTNSMLFGGDLQHNSHCVVSCTFSNLQGLQFDNAEHPLKPRLKIVLNDIRSCLKTFAGNFEFSQNNFWNEACRNESLSLRQFITNLIDGLSNSYNQENAHNRFESFENEECQRLCGAYFNLICDAEGNLKPVFCNLLHNRYTFLPVRDLEKTVSGRIGVKSMSYFLESSETALAHEITEAEKLLGICLFENVRAQFPKILRQFVQNNTFLILLRLSNTLLVAQGVHVDNLHGFPHSQFGCFLALNSNQHCHVYLDTTNENFEFCNPDMRKGFLNVFKSSTYAHAGLSCSCDGSAKLAITLYHDCVLELSTGSVRKLATNANSFVNAFESLCLSKVPCVSNCGGCRLEIIVNSVSIATQEMDVYWCDVCDQFRCVYCRHFSLREHARVDKKATFTDINTFLENCQINIMESTSHWKPICTHTTEELRRTTAREIMKAFITPKQLTIYSKNTIEMLAKMNLSQIEFKEKTVKQVFELLRVPCLRSFVLSACMLMLYIDPLAESVCVLFSGKDVDVSELSARITSVTLNSVDKEFLWGRSRQYLQLISKCLESCLHLRCTAKGSSDSATCACGVTPLTKVSRDYVKMHGLATKQSNALLHMVN